MPSDAAADGWSQPNDGAWANVRELSASLSHPDFADRIRSMLRDYVGPAHAPKRKLDSAFITNTPKIMLTGEEHLRGNLSDETALRLYCCDRFHFEKARELLALPDSIDGKKSPEERAADQRCIETIDRALDVIKTATPILFPKGIYSHEHHGKLPPGRVRKPKPVPATERAPQSADPISI